MSKTISALDERDAFQYALLAILWLMPFVQVEPAPVDFLIIALGGYLFLRRPSAYWRDLPPLARAGVAILLASHISLLWAPAWGRAGFYTLATVEMFVILVLFTRISDHEGAWRWRRLAVAYIGGSTLAATIGVLAYFDLLPYREIFMYRELRAMGFFKGPNIFGGYLVSAVVLLWAIVVSCPRPQPAPVRARFIEGATAFLLVLGIVLSGSRMAWVGLGLGLALYFALTIMRGMDWKRWLRGWAIALGMLLAVIMIFHPEVWSMFKDRATLMQDYDQKRFRYQEEALSTFITSTNRFNPFGLGPGQSEVVLGYATHNLYLRVLYELGIIGGLGLALLLSGAGWALWRHHRADVTIVLPLAAVLLTILAMSFVIDTLHWRHFFAFLGLALVGSKPLGGHHEG